MSVGSDIPDPTYQYTFEGHEWTQAYFCFFISNVGETIGGLWEY